MAAATAAQSIPQGHILWAASAMRANTWLAARFCQHSSCTAAWRLASAEHARVCCMHGQSSGCTTSNYTAQQGRQQGILHVQGLTSADIHCGSLGSTTSCRTRRHLNPAKRFLQCFQSALCWARQNGVTWSAIEFAAWQLAYINCVTSESRVEPKPAAELAARLASRCAGAQGMKTRCHQSQRRLQAHAVQSYALADISQGLLL